MDFHSEQGYFVDLINDNILESLEHIVTKYGLNMPQTTTVVTILTTGKPAEGSISSSDLTGPLEGKTINDLVDLMKEGKIYVNLHSPDFEDGEIRGQVK